MNDSKMKMIEEIQRRNDALNKSLLLPANEVARLRELTLELRRLPEMIRWRATIGFTERPMSYGILGTRGFFEFFRLAYDARAGFLIVEPNDSLPA